MNRERKIMLNVMILIVSLCMAGVGWSAPMGTAFTYQGRLTDANSPAEGLYDFEFAVYNALEGGGQQGSTVDVNDLDVIDGYFTVPLDFGSSVLDGDARWLEIAVRPGESEDPCDYATLEPRQELTPTPYALQTRGIFVDRDGNVGISTTNPSEKLDVNGRVSASAYTGGSPLIFEAPPGIERMRIEDSGNVGIGVTGPGAKLDVETDSGWAVNGLTTDDFGIGVKGTSSGDYGYGVQGWATASGNFQNHGGHFEAAGDFGVGVYGEAEATGNVMNYGGRFVAKGDTGQGVFGYAMASGSVANYGGYFWAAGDTGRGVYGTATATGTGEMNYGGYFEAARASGCGVYGEATGDVGRGVFGKATATGDVENYGGYFEAAGDDGRGVYGKATGDGATGVYGYAAGSSGIGVYSEATGWMGIAVCGKAEGARFGGYFTSSAYVGRGVVGTASGNSGHGVHGEVSANHKNAVAVYGAAPDPNARAGCFQGDVEIFGDLTVIGSVSKVGGSFVIDHPLDPANKYLSHSFVESPDMMNVYNGNVVLDENGGALIKLPEYFEALNADFRYQLTAIGAPAPNLYIAEEISRNCFKIGGGQPGMKVSWQVTGVRQDAYAVANRIKVEEDKPVEARGSYLHPEAYGLPKEKSIETACSPQPFQDGKVARKVGES